MTAKIEPIALAFQNPDTRFNPKRRHFGTDGGERRYGQGGCYDKSVDLPARRSEN